LHIKIFKKSAEQMAGSVKRSGKQLQDLHILPFCLFLRGLSKIIGWLYFFG
jgi:hypothetical protein